MPTSFDIAFSPERSRRVRTGFDTPAVRATGGITDGTTSHSTRLPNDASQVHPQGVRRGCKGLKPQQRTQAGYQGERLLTKTVTTPFVLSALRSKVYRSMSGVAAAVSRIIVLKWNWNWNEKSAQYTIRLPAAD